MNRRSYSHLSMVRSRRREKVGVLKLQRDVFRADDIGAQRFAYGLRLDVRVGLPESGVGIVTSI